MDIKGDKGRFCKHFNAYARTIRFILNEIVYLVVHVTVLFNM